MPIFKDLTGSKINNWNILEFKGFNKHKQSMWLVECDCELKTQRIKTINAIKQYNSCGCLSIENLKGKEFGRWKVISDPIHKNNRIYFECQCSCEKKTIKLVRPDRLKDGTSQSCGCLALENKTKHGLAYERLTNIWYGIIDRCSNPRRDDYERYGGRGIKVCEQWSSKNNYEGLLNFTEWAKQNGYDNDLSIERIDVNGNYEPDNCKWITMEEQAKNKTNTIYLTINDGYEKLTAIRDTSGISRETILKRYKLGIRNRQKLISKINLRNTSGIVGVSYSNNQDNWRSFINIDGKRIELGRRKNKEDAIILRLEAEKKYFGDNAPQSYLFTKYKIGEINNAV